MGRVAPFGLLCDEAFAIKGDDIELSSVLRASYSPQIFGRHRFPVAQSNRLDCRDGPPQ
jgi:hypothetical protein